MAASSPSVGGGVGTSECWCDVETPTQRKRGDSTFRRNNRNVCVRRRAIQRASRVRWSPPTNDPTVTSSTVTLPASRHDAHTTMHIQLRTVTHTPAPLRKGLWGVECILAVIGTGKPRTEEGGAGGAAPSEKSLPDTLRSFPSSMNFRRWAAGGTGVLVADEQLAIPAAALP
eukprot:1399665-Pyramimonas_sp.AAC.1